MPTLQLRSHIPIASPARREAADGTEARLRVSLGFEPAWFHRRCSIDFGERWHTDPYYRHDTLVVMLRELKSAFPTVDYWDSLSDGDLWTLSGAYGAYVLARWFGAELRYAPERWPTPAAPVLALDAVDKLDLNTLLANALVADLHRQMDIIEKEAGRIHGYLNWQGILNNTFILTGQDIFSAMVDSPELARRWFEFMADAMTRLAREIQDRQARSGFPVDHLSVSNCTINMLSPAFYRDFIFPCDKKIAESFARFGVHTCNWNATRYLDGLARLPNVGYVDMGLETDLTRAKQLFPEARRAVMYSPVKLEQAPLDAIERDLQRIDRELAPCDVVLADISWTTPNARVTEFLDLCRKLEMR